MSFGLPETPFGWVELRSRDVGASRAFYRDALGFTGDAQTEGFALSRDGRRFGALGALSDRQRGLGVPSHWLGHLTLGDRAAAAVQALVAHGGVTLGPSRADLDGFAVVTLRDPGGAVYAVSERPPSEAATGYRSTLHTPDLATALAHYAALAWRAEERLASPFGPYALVATPEGARVGVLGNAGQGGVHPHWLVSFSVDDLDRAVARARDAGARVVHRAEGRDGRAVVVADDPQGAAFSLCSA